MSDALSTLDRIVELVTDARAMPLSASCVVNRGELLGLLDELRDGLPAELAAARHVLSDREGAVEAGRREAAEIVEAAHAERERLVAGTGVARDAADQARLLVDDARATAAAMRTEVEDYIDGKLATFEIVLSRTLDTVHRGREKMQGHDHLDDLAELDEAAAG